MSNRRPAHRDGDPVAMLHTVLGRKAFPRDEKPTGWEGGVCLQLLLGSVLCL